MIIIIFHSLESLEVSLPGLKKYNQIVILTKSIYLGVWPHGNLVRIVDTSNGSSNETSIKGLLPVHLLDRLHGLPLGQFSGDTGNSCCRGRTPSSSSRLLLNSLVINSCNTNMKF